MSSTLAERYRSFVEKNGGWSGHNVHLGDGLYTMGERSVVEELALRRMVQLVADMAGKPLKELRILDLGCHEGSFAIEFARQGAEVVGIEGRDSALDRARFVKDALGLERLTFHCDDVRNLSEARYGRFDVVLCLGLLYHLDEKSVLDLLGNIAGVCDRMSIVHTHIGIAPVVSCAWHGQTYWGRHFLEHLKGEDKESAGWASLDNDTSFWITRASLCNALMDVGFTSVTETRIPYIPWQPDDHLSLVAMRGERVHVESIPALNTTPWERLPERKPFLVNPGQKAWYPAYRWVKSHLPVGAREPLVRMTRRIGRMFGMYWATPRQDRKDN